MNRRFILLLILVLCTHYLVFPAGENTTDNKVKKYTNKADNAKCFRCHGHHKFEMTYEGKKYFYKMPSDYVIDTNAYYASNHWNFKCFDCHSEDYLVAPHRQDLRFSSMSTCMDCHGGDKIFAKYNFEKINEEFQASVHSSRHNDDFSCWSCHDAHTYKINARNKNQDIQKTIAYDNSICLSCHANWSKYSSIKETATARIIGSHDWLPNQANHFQKVRCIECHAAQNDSILVAHKIMPKSKAVRKCVECHSTNSLLRKSLYKYKVMERRGAQGFFNANILADYYVIGANRNYYLNVISIIVFFLTLVGIGIHIAFRIMKK